MRCACAWCPGVSNIANGVTYVALGFLHLQLHLGDNNNSNNNNNDPTTTPHNMLVPPLLMLFLRANAPTTTLPAQITLASPPVSKKSCIHKLNP